jgi:hypothetical protein
MLLKIAPAGSFGAIDARTDRIVGTAIGIDYGSFGWIAMMLVDPAFRSQGLGGRLLEAAMNAVPNGLPIRLDATPMGRPLYQRFGFVDETMLTRHVAGAADRGAPVDGHVDHDPRAQPIDDGDLPAIGECDSGTFGGNRRAVLEWARKNAPHYARVLRTSASERSYCFGRQGRRFDQIGPIVAADDAGARALLRAAMAAADGRSVVVDTFDEMKGFAEWLRERGFRAERPLYRMCRAGTTAFVRHARREGAIREFAIFGPEFA